MTLATAISTAAFAAEKPAPTTRAAATRPVKIAVVRTYDQLQAQPVITLPGGTKVQLGLESAECPRNGGALLYCLAGGTFVPKSRRKGWLGPVRVAAASRRPEAKTHPVELFARRSAHDLRNAKALFARAIVPAGKGRTYVSVQDATGREIAIATLAARKDRPNPWTPLLRDKYRRAAEDEAPPNRRVPNWYVENGRTGPAIPYWDPAAVLDLVEGRYAGQQAGKYPKGERLPTCLPRGTHPAIRAEVRSDAHSTVLTVTAAASIYTCHPKDHFLTRWWVNGKPFIPKPVMAHLSEGNGVLTRGTRLRLHLLLNPAKLGAKKGDRIRLQLLYCHRGWRWSPGPGELAKLVPNDFLETRGVLSLRVGQDPSRVLWRYGLLMLEPVEFVVK